MQYLRYRSAKEHIILILVSIITVNDSYITVIFLLLQAFVNIIGAGTSSQVVIVSMARGILFLWKKKEIHSEKSVSAITSIEYT